jgi:alpha-beta hydrolase superfamily lysophospholipase
MDFFSRVWQEESVRSVILPFAGIGGHAGDFDSWGEVLAGEGIAVAGRDLPGFGVRLEEPLSDPRGAVAEVDAAIGEARSRWPGRPVVTAGDSLGSLIVLAHAAQGESRADGHILASPAIRTPGKISPQGVALIWLRMILGSRKPYDFTGQIEALTGDPEEREDLLGDPLRRRTLPPKWLFRVRMLQRGALETASTVMVPTLILWGENDRVASFPAARALLSVIPAPLRRLEVIGGELHMLTRGIRRHETAGLIARWVTEEIVRQAGPVERARREGRPVRPVRRPEQPPPDPSS